ncbi:TIGR03084 family metal-binding protein [Kitasatospora sp. McL0602]|uniref:TIGR03084 family metal-binding protein n=1 Tax=Kitasatospora sp. McL0602 TaxID=3439530 RepID=UPI003F8AE33D
MIDLTALLADLTAESAELDALVAGLSLDGLATETPAPGWTIAHQLSHLAWTDRWALLAARDADGFAKTAAEVFTDGSDPIEAGAAEGVGESPEALLGRWRAGRAELATALAEADGRQLPWFGPPMKPGTMATARLMETWAHGQDVADALGVTRTPTARLRQVAHLGVRTMGFAFALHGLPTPEAPVRVELTGPAGESWVWGPEDAADRITGPALDFCLLVTQRRSLGSLALRSQGPTAQAWLPIAQAFAGPPGAGR